MKRLLVAFFILWIPFAFAAPTKSKKSAKKAPAVETYPAMEDQEIIAEKSYSVPVLDDSLDGTAKTNALEERLLLLEKRYAQQDGVKKSSQIAQNQIAVPAPPVAEIMVASESASLKPVAATAPAATPDYFEVPKDKNEMMAKRMKLAYAILKETGRAYDYRSHKTAELQSLLDAAKAAKKSAQ